MDAPKPTVEDLTYLIPSNLMNAVQEAQMLIERIKQDTLLNYEDESAQEIVADLKRADDALLDAWQKVGNRGRLDDNPVGTVHIGEVD